MEWQNKGVVLSVEPHGETSAIISLFTRDYGRHMGLVRGGRSRRLRAVLQTGNSVLATWRARLEDHLGAFTLEPDLFRAAGVIDDALKLNALSSLCALAGLLPERHPYQPLHDAFLLVLDALDDDDLWPALAVRWEMGLLETLGFGLDLLECAGTGTRDNLIYVSPKSGRAVSAEAGEPYKEKLLALPGFLSHDGARASGVERQDVLDGFVLTGYFLDQHVFQPRGLKVPQARGRMLERLMKQG